jgi:hypothetical protein
VEVVCCCADKESSESLWFEYTSLETEAFIERVRVHLYTLLETEGFPGSGATDVGY